MKTRTHEHIPEQRKIQKMEDFRLYMKDESIKTFLEIFFICIFISLSIGMFFIIPFIYVIIIFGILLGIIGFMYGFFTIFRTIIGYEPYKFTQGRMHLSLKNAIQDKNLFHHWHFLRDKTLETRFKKFLFFNLVGAKILVFSILLFLLNILIPFYTGIPHFIIVTLLFFTLPFYFRDFINFYFYREKYKVIVLQNNPKTYYWKGDTIFFY